MKSKAILALSLALLSTAAGVFSFQSKKEKAREDAAFRSVEGKVTDHNDNPVENAVVQLKNSKTLQIRSFITKQDGNYSFHRLSTNVDYEVKADHLGVSSSVKTLSVFDSRKKPLINLKLESKKEPASSRP